MDDIQSQIDEITSRQDDGDQSLQDLSDNTDSTVSDIQSTIDDHQTTLDDLSSNEGQLTFPLSQDTISLIKEQFPTGFVTLVAGTYILKDTRIGATSNIYLTASQVIGAQGILSYSPSAGQAIINSSSNTDTSIISYVIFN